MDSNITTSVSAEHSEEFIIINNDIKSDIPINYIENEITTVCNLQDLCRICMSNENEMFSLFDTKENDLSLLQMFISFTSIKVSKEDGLPSQICSSCKIQVLFCYDFKNKCKSTDATLKSILKGNFISKDDEVDTESAKIADDYVYDVKVETEAQIYGSPEYLEDFNDVKIENYENSLVSEVSNRKDIDVIVTDSKYFLEEIVGHNKKIAPESSYSSLKKIYTCRSCPKKFFKMKTLKTHMQQEHVVTPNPYKCPQCKESFLSEHDLAIHSSLHPKGSIWRCNKCHKVFKARPMLRRHIFRHMESKRFNCDWCQKPFTEMCALKRHIRVHTGELLEKKHKCNICDKRYSSRGALAAHAARHSGVRPCACAVCGKRFPSARLLTSHARTHAAKRLACRYCARLFRHRSTRAAHQRTHTGEKPYVCSVCGKTFIQNSNLTLHMRTHTGERPYSCTTCSKKFKSGSSLKMHMRTHTGEKPYGCNLCGKRFAKLDMSVHMRHHTGERPFACQVCPKKFVLASRLRDHQRVHTGEKPFECATCTHKFATKSHLVKHIKVHQKGG